MIQPKQTYVIIQTYDRENKSYSTILGKGDKREKYKLYYVRGWKKKVVLNMLIIQTKGLKGIFYDNSIKSHGGGGSNLQVWPISF